MAQPSCSDSGLYGLNCTGSVAQYLSAKPSPLYSYSGLVLHYYLYYSNIRIQHLLMPCHVV